MIRLSMAMRFKIGAGFSIFLVIFIGSLSVYQLHTQDMNIQTILENDFSLIELIEKGSVILTEFQQRHLEAFRDPNKQTTFTDLISGVEKLDVSIQTRVKENQEFGATATVLLKAMEDFKTLFQDLANASYSTTLKGFQDVMEKHAHLLATFRRLDKGQREILMLHKEWFGSLSKNAQGQMAILVVITVIIAIMLSVYFSQQIALPVRRLRELITRIREGNYDISARPHADDEIGEIFHALVRMAEHINIRDRLKLDKIDLERRRFITLANHVGIPLLLVNSQNLIAAANNGALELFRASIDDIFEVEMARSPLPPKLKEKIISSITKSEWPVGAVVDVSTDTHSGRLGLTMVPVENSQGTFVSVICLLEHLGGKSIEKSST
ncbi:MAG: HAMP domain-containing protein [Candidatus Ozemobacteraceae bacterium]